MPDSWGRVVATANFDNFLSDAIWSPCDRFVAVAKSGSLELLDATTLGRLCSFETPGNIVDQQLGFSPDSRLLTLRTGGEFISWDLQTGGRLGIFISSVEDLGTERLSFTHSEDGKMVAVAYGSRSFSNFNGIWSALIDTYDLLSGRCVGFRHVPEGQIIRPIWTHDGYLRFATIDPKSIRIGQSPFTLEHPPVEVASFPVPDGITDAANGFLFLPSLSRLAFTLEDEIQVWDLKTLNLLLESELAPDPGNKWDQWNFRCHDRFPCGSFTSDGRFFAYTDATGEVCVWEESSTGYLLHQRLRFDPSDFSPGPRLSSNGESIITLLYSKIHRWHTRDQDLSLPSVSTEDSGHNKFTLGFSVDEKFAVFGRRKEKTVTIIDLQSGEPRWIANVGVGIDCLGMAGSTVVLVGEEKIVTWNLPGGDSSFNASIDDSVRTTVLHNSSKRHGSGTPTYMSISPDLSRIIVARAPPQAAGYSLEVVNVSTGLCLASIETYNMMRPRFTQDGREVWVADSPFSHVLEQQCEIIEDRESGAVELKLQGAQGLQSEVFRESSSGYAIADSHGRWVLNPSQKRLLWLPHRWRSNDMVRVGKNRAWSGRFLGLLHCELSEVVILEFLE